MSQYQAQQFTNLPVADRYRIVQDEMAHSGFQPNNILTKTEFYELLDSRAPNRIFDRGIADQLYDRAQKDHSGRLLVDEFIKVFIEAQDFLTQNLFQTQQHLQEYEAQRLDAIEKLNELRQEESLNQYGIMIGSILTVQVLELKSLERAQFKDVYVQVTCGENVFQTEAFPYSNGMEWNEQFNIEVLTGHEQINIGVIAYGPGGDGDILGQVMVPLRDLEDQFFRDQYFDLVTQRGAYAGGQIHLKLQWIHSRVKYLESVIRKWEESIQVQLEDKEDFEQSLNALGELFRLQQNPSVHQNQNQQNLPYSGRGSEHGYSHSHNQSVKLASTNRDKYPEQGRDYYLQEDYQIRLSQQNNKRGASLQGSISKQPQRSGHKVAAHYQDDDLPVTMSQNIPKSNLLQPQTIDQPRFSGSAQKQQYVFDDRSSAGGPGQMQGQGRESAGFGGAPVSGVRGSATAGPNTNRLATATGQFNTGAAISALLGIQGGQDEVMIDWREHNDFGKYAFFGSIALLIVTMFSCFMKASYLELILCFGFLQAYDLNKRYTGNAGNLLLMIFIMVIAIVWGAIWLALYTGGWGDDAFGYDPEYGVLVFVLFVEYISWLLKLALVYCYWNFFQQVKARSGGRVVIAGFNL